MKNFKKIIVAVTILMLCFTSVIIAQPSANGALPTAVTTAFNIKCPNAQLKRWQIKNGTYTAKATIDNHKYFVSFDRDGNWLSTASNIPWQWDLPKNINSAYNKTRYNNWNVYYAKKVEKPSGEYYQLLVDDTNLHMGQNNRPLYNTDKLLEFKANGALAMVKDITEDPAP